ncbi:MAG: disulfide bond formation protein B [Sphingomonadaceae bacterium]
MNAARRSALLLILISGSLLAGALWFQYGVGLPPCEMCFWQRYAHLGVLTVAGFAAAFGRTLVVWLAVLAMLVAASLGLFHAGVEQGWWQGVTACTSAMQPGMTQADIFATIMNSPLVRCDQIPWQFLGLSMAAWNALISAVAASAAAVILWRR